MIKGKGKLLANARKRLEEVQQRRIGATIGSQGLSELVDRPNTKRLIADAIAWCNDHKTHPENVWGVNWRLMCLNIGEWRHLDEVFASWVLAKGFNDRQSIVGETIKQSAWDSANGLCISKCS